MASLPQQVQETLSRIVDLVSARELAAPKNDPYLTKARMEQVMLQPPQLLFEFLQANTHCRRRGDSIRQIEENLLINRPLGTEALFFVIAPAAILPEGVVKRPPTNKDDVLILPFAITAYGYRAQNFA